VPADSLQLSVVVPVYNGGGTIATVVEETLRLQSNLSLEIILVDDGSIDCSSVVCEDLVRQHSDVIRFVQLARNYGEHSAVLAGLAQVRGRIVAIIDDDGQQDPDDLLQMVRLLQSTQGDVVYGVYRHKHHPVHRQFLSWLSGQTARLLLGKPAELYLSSFKVMSRFVVDRITQYRGPFPYLDGLILQSTNRIFQVQVRHRSRLAGRSGYTFPRLMRLWMNMAVGFSILPLRLSLWVGLAAATISFILLIDILIEKLWLQQNLPLGIPELIAALSFFSGLEFVLLGVLGEYLGRSFLTISGAPQYVIRSITESNSRATPDQPPRSLNERST
jgi:undecaprenyl-phosphate 4-deoxy-4-formamido-L-arabinose transferase